MKVKIEAGWKELMQDYFDSPVFQSLTSFVKQTYQTQQVYPPPGEIFQAFDACPLDQTRVVILGQDPYHGPGQAHGLCFSVNEGIPHPPSLQNIFKELQTDLGKSIPTSGDLSPWAAQGVLLLNATLTVQAHQAGSHQKKGWEEFTDEVIRRLAAKKKGLVFLLWGSYAQRKAAVVLPNEHLLLKAPHPSPLSAHRGFFGCRHFSQTNAYLANRGERPIDW